MANQLAMIKEEVFNKVSEMVNGYVSRGELALPAGYSPENAMKSAWLVLQDVVDTNKRPVLESCTRTSIINALQRSYFGSMRVAKTVDPTITGSNEGTFVASNDKISGLTPINLSNEIVRETFIELSDKEYKGFFDEGNLGSENMYRIPTKLTIPHTINGLTEYATDG